MNQYTNTLLELTEAQARYKRVRATVSRCILVATWGFVFLAVVAMGLAFQLVPWAILVFVAGCLWFGAWFVGGLAWGHRSNA